MKYKYSLGSLILKESVVETLMMYRQLRYNASESGGILLGRYLNDSYDLVIDFVTIPQASDKRSTINFYRSEQHQLYIDKFHKESEGSCNYIGEWHSHPKGINSPSQTDIKSWKIQLNLHPNYFPIYPLFFIIVCYEKIKIWEGSKENLEFNKLEAINDL